MFVVAVSEYDCRLREDNTTNRLKYAAPYPFPLYFLAMLPFWDVN